MLGKLSDDAYLVGGEHAASGWVNITEVDLDGGLVLGTDQTVRS